MRTKLAFVSLAICIIFASGPAQAQGTTENTQGACKDGIDNDGDGFMDCADQDCAPFVFCASSAAPAPAPAPIIAGPENSLAACKDKGDNDGDGFTDCVDQDCQVFSMCVSPAPTYGAAPAPAYAAAPVAAAPRKPVRMSKGGIGLYLGPMITPKGKRGMEGDTFGVSWKTKQESRLDPAFALGIFGEALPVKFFAVGGEAHLVFWNVDEGREWDSYYGWSSWDSCSYCDTNVGFDLHARLKFPFALGQYVALYPIVTVGMEVVSMRHDHGDPINTIGIGYSGGLGVELRTPTVIYPFIEVRYMGGVSFAGDTAKEAICDYMMYYYGEYLEPNDIDKATAMHNSVVINFGLRIL